MKIKRETPCSIAFITDKKEVVGQYQLREGSDHQARLQIAIDKKISNWRWYIIVYGNGRGKLKGMSKSGKAWFEFDNKFNIIKTYPIFPNQIKKFSCRL